VAGTGIICQYAGVKWGQGFYHGFSAWLVFVFALAALFIESAVISALCPERKEKADAGMKGDAAKT
jgi:hypothetical protein